MRYQKRKNLVLWAALAVAMLVSLVGASIHAQAKAGRQKAEIWRFDQIQSIDGLPTQVLGHPSLIETPYGKAVQFNGVDDALIIGQHPLARAETWTWEVIFRPDVDGAAEQRFFHLSVQDPATGKDTRDRMLFEMRVRSGQWCLDSFAQTGHPSMILLNCEKLHPLGQWYRVTAVYDGTTLKNYVGDELQGQGEVHLLPQGAGHASVGVRITLVNYFKGAVLEARFTRRALKVSEFLKMPKEK